MDKGTVRDWSVGRIERRPLRDVWRHEAYDFTAWLADNIDVVGEAIGIELVSAERERAAGIFSLDILAEDKDGQLVIIENQLGQSDHDHLGKLLTYLTAFGAETAVWIVAHPRPEHVNAVTWLNEASSGAFYMLKVEAISIGESLPAPLFTLIVGPTEETRNVGEIKREKMERHSLRREFFEGLLKFASPRTPLHRNLSAGDSNWVGTSAGVPGSLSYVVLQHDARVELYIDLGKGQEERNLELFERLFQNKEEVEGAFGEPLTWEALEGRRACRISSSVGKGGYRDQDKWAEIFEDLVDRMVRLELALRPHLQRMAY